MSVNSPADVDDEALVVHAGIHPALRGPTVVVVSTQADHAVRATFTVGALNERLNQRAPLLAQARKILLGQRGIDDVAWRLMSAGQCGGIAVDLMIGVWFLGHPRTPSRVLGAAGVTAGASFLVRTASGLAKIVDGLHPPRYCTPIKQTASDALEFVLALVVSGLIEFAPDDAARRPGALGNVAVVGLVVALVNAALAVVIGVIDRRHMLAVELCRRADELSVMGHREEQRRDAVVYLDRNKRITVDVGLRPDRLPPETLRPRIYATPSTEGLTSSQIELLLAALNLSRALAERWAPALITEAMQCFDATLRAVNPPPADAGLDAHALRLTLDHIVYARQAYQRDVAHRGAAAPAHD